jgi:hypothetical protein
MTDPHEFDELEEEPPAVTAAAKRFAAALRTAKHCVVYTGIVIFSLSVAPFLLCV